MIILNPKRTASLKLQNSQKKNSRAKRMYKKMFFNLSTMQKETQKDIFLKPNRLVFKQIENYNKYLYFLENTIPFYKSDINIILLNGTVRNDKEEKDQNLNEGDLKEEDNLDHDSELHEIDPNDDYPDHDVDISEDLKKNINTEKDNNLENDSDEVNTDIEI